MDNKLQNNKSSSELSAEMGDFDILKLSESTSYTIRSAAKNGYLDIVKWLYTLGTSTAVDCAAFYGNLKVMEFLQSKNINGTTDAIDLAARNGYLEVVKWLYTNNLQGTPNALNWAAEKGYLEVIQWLYSQGLKYDTASIYYSVKIKYPDIAKWMEKN